jgi:hypothetical protein
VTCDRAAGCLLPNESRPSNVRYRLDSTWTVAVRSRGGSSAETRLWTVHSLARQPFRSCSRADGGVGRPRIAQRSAVCRSNAVWGGRTGIRTQERVAPSTVFKTVAFVRSAILPGGSLPAWHSRHWNDLVGQSTTVGGMCSFRRGIRATWCRTRPRSPAGVPCWSRPGQAPWPAALLVWSDRAETGFVLPRTSIAWDGRVRDL